MRRLLLPAVLALGVTSAPAQAADVKIQNFSFMPASITIGQGDTVTWTWAGPDTNHSVTSDPNQAHSLDSDPARTPTPAHHLPPPPSPPPLGGPPARLDLRPYLQHLRHVRLHLQGARVHDRQGGRERAERRASSG